MFYILSKLLNVLISPFFWAVLVLVVSLFGFRRYRRHFQIFAVVVLLFFSNNLIFNTVARMWEADPVEPSVLSEDHRTVVVLSGMVSENETTGYTRFERSADRLWQGLWLLKEEHADTMVFTGGVGGLFNDQRSESALVEDFLRDVDLMDERILFEPGSRNTYENARNSAALFEELEMEKKIILVTSAFHIPRARACFEHQGFDVDVFPADPVASVRPPDWKDFVIPSPAVMEQWRVLFNEWAGFVMYWLNGYL